MIPNLRVYVLILWMRWPVCEIDAPRLSRNGLAEIVRHFSCGIVRFACPCKSIIGMGGIELNRQRAAREPKGIEKGLFRLRLEALTLERQEPTTTTLERDYLARYRTASMFSTSLLAKRGLRKPRMSRG